MNTIEAKPSAEGWDALLSIDDVATLLKVPKSWVYGRTRRRGKDRLPFLKLGKYVRFEEAAVRVWLRAQRRSALHGADSE